MKRLGLSVFVVCSILAGGSLVQAATGDSSKDNSAQMTEAKCELLDDAKAKGKMDGLLKWLLVECGRENELGQVRQAPAQESMPDSGPGAGDVQVNDSSGDGTGSTTQSETSIIVSPTTGTLCSGYNDSASGIGSGSFTGFSRSTDDGATWDDRGALPDGSSGDPSIVWRKTDGKFYFVALRNGGLAIWRSDDDCLTFTLVSQIVTGSDDKELMAIDNNPSSPYYGRIYVAWTDFGQGAEIWNVYSDDAGATWSTQVQLSGSGVDVQGAWPAVAPNGDYYVAWLRWDPYPSGPVTVEIVKSTDGGDTFGAIPSPMAGEVNPRDSAATSSCGRPALNGNIRYLPSPQIQVGTDGALHVVYAYDPDGFNNGDVSDVFYRKYAVTANGAGGWGPEVLLNDDDTDNDQYFPNLSVGDENIVVVTFYDRRLSATNLEQDTFKTVSPDGGETWLANERVSNVSTPIYLDPNLATCYHGDYDQITQVDGMAFLQWADDRNIANGHNDPDVWFEATPVSNDFVVTADPSARWVCAPAEAGYDLDVLQFQGFGEPVTLSAAGNPAGTSVTFSDNPVTPPDSLTMTIGNTVAATPGAYSITVTGTSDPSAIERDTTVSLNIFSVIPLAPDLTSPANGEENLGTSPTFTWDAVDQAAEYKFELATDPDFVNKTDSASGLTGTSYTTSAVLDTNTEYFWRVRAENACGSGGESAAFAFRTFVAPGDCSDPASTWQHYYESFESGAPLWVHSAGVGPDTWELSTEESVSGTTSYHADDVSLISDQYLVSPPISLTAESGPYTLQFWNLQNIESSSSGCFDAGVLEISTDSGANWTRLDSELQTDPYDGVIDDGYQNPLADENGWCGDPEPWVKSIVNIDAWAGSVVQFRFRLATDSSVSQPGWWIDDVEVQSCGVLFADGVNEGTTGRWTETVTGN